MSAIKQIIAIFGLCGAVSIGASADVENPGSAGGSASCAYFSPNPQDTAGPPINFYADLSPDEESAVTESPGRGRVDFVLDRATLKFSWHATFNGVTSRATQLYVHGPGTPGGEAGMILDLAPHGIKSPTAGETVLNEGYLVYLVQDRLYVNLHTARFPGGELRGTIRKARSKC